LENELPHNVLIISNKPPYPIVDGGCFAMSKFEQLLKDKTKQLYYFSISTNKHPFKKEALPSYFKLNENYFNSYINTKVQPKHITSFIAGNSLRAKRFYSPQTLQSIIQLIQNKNIDIVIFESIYSAVYLNEINKMAGVKTFLRAHNIEHHIWSKYSIEKSGLKKTIFEAENKRLKTLEDELLFNTTGNIFISNNDGEYYKNKTNKNNFIVLPTQLSTHPAIAKPTPNKLRLFHIGAMDWLPNVEGVEHFIQQIFPSILQKYPLVELHLAGKSMPAYFHKYASNNIFIHGEVDDATTFINQFDVLVVPILTGSGIRIKILEAMALGKPVITTQAGIEGIPATNQQQVIIVNNTNEWISGIDFLNTPTQYQNILTNALKFIEENYSEKFLQEKLINFIKSQLN